MAKYTPKTLKFKLANDKKFVEKLRQCENDLANGRTGFFVSFQTLVGFASFKILTSVMIEDKKLKNKFFQISNKSGNINAIETLNLLCRVFENHDLFNELESTAFNDYANVDKHGKIFIPFDSDVANECKLEYNNFIKFFASKLDFVTSACKLMSVAKDTSVEDIPQAQSAKKLQEELEQQFEEIVQNEKCIAETDFSLGNSTYNLRIIKLDWDFDCYRHKSIETFSYKVTKNCVIRLTLLKTFEKNTKKSLWFMSKPTQVYMIHYGDRKFDYYTDCDVKVIEFNHEKESKRISLTECYDDTEHCYPVKLKLEGEFKYTISNKEETFEFVYNTKTQKFEF